MEEFNKNTEADDVAMSKAYNLTYKMFTGKLSITDVLSRYKNVELLYDPYEFSSDEFVDILEEMLDYYIEIEYYERCAKLRDIINDKKSHDDKLKNLTLDSKEKFFSKQADLWDPSKTTKKSNAVDYLIAKLRDMGRERLESRFRDMLREAKKDDITDPEIWTLLSVKDRDIFDNDYSKFAKWVGGLTTTIRDEYIERLLENKPLIPEGEELDDFFFSLDTIDKIDYTNNVVISYLDNMTIISHSNLERINEIRETLKSNGITDIETRIKDHGEGYNVYSLVYTEGGDGNSYLKRKKD